MGLKTTREKRCSVIRLVLATVCFGFRGTDEPMTLGILLLNARCPHPSWPDWSPNSTCPLLSRFGNELALDVKCLKLVIEQSESDLRNHSSTKQTPISCHKWQECGGEPGSLPLTATDASCEAALRPWDASLHKARSLPAVTGLFPSPTRLCESSAVCPAEE